MFAPSLYDEALHVCFKPVCCDATLCGATLCRSDVVICQLHVLMYVLHATPALQEADPEGTGRISQSEFLALMLAK